MSVSGAGSTWNSTKPLTGRVRRCTAGHIETFLCANVEVLAYLPVASLGQSSGYDFWGWHDSTTGREFAVVGGQATAFVEVTDPLHPRYLGVLPPPAGTEHHAAQSVRVYQHYAFIGYEGVDAGLQIFDLAPLRAVQQPQTFTETAHYAGVTNTHTITVNQATGLLSINGSNTCGGGLHLVDVRTPTTPKFLGCYPETLGDTHKNQSGYVHDAECVIYRGPDVRYRGRELCVNYAEEGIGIVDVTDRQHLKAISHFSYPNVAYTHQGWFTDDQRYIYVDDEYDESDAAATHQVSKDSIPTRTLGFDLQHLEDPVLLVEYRSAQGRGTDHNLFIHGRYMYQGNYRSGLRIVDVANPKVPKEVGYLRLSPTDSAGPSWAWGAYPYFQHDVVAVPMTSGLVLARLQTR